MNSKLQIIAIIFILCLWYASSVVTNEDHEYWFNLGKNDIDNALKIEQYNNDAKNVIVFMGDGMGLSTITAARIYSKTEIGYFSFEKFPHIATLKTYSADKLVPDSCSTATALFGGVKANYKTSGVDYTVKLDDCEASLKVESHVDSILKWAQKAGKSTGFVTTTRVTHATPSALYAHTPNRKWECESAIPKSGEKCVDIARQLVENEPGKNINVIMGGGRQCLQTNINSSDDDPLDTWACRRKDGQDLIKTWKEDKQTRQKRYTVVTNNQELEEIDLSADFVLGIFANGHLKMDHARDRSPRGMPSLANMTKKAIEILSKNPNGYILMVEGGMIDFAHHRGHAKQALSETSAFNDAIETALPLIDFKDTLVIVTSDHDHSMTISGYPNRGHRITGIGKKSKIDGVPYTSLLYTTGGENNYKYTVVNGKVVRTDPSVEDLDDFQYSQQAAILDVEVTHAGTDVLVYAKGPMAHLFNSVHEQTYVAYVIGFAMKIGPFESNGAMQYSLGLYVLALSCIISFIVK